MSFATPEPNKLAYTLEEFHRAGGPGRSRAYELIAEGKLRAVKDGNRTLIPVEEARRYIASLPTLASREA
jgi:excisionase family DNA binding protein